MYRSPRGTGFPITGAASNFNDPTGWSEIRDPTQLVLDLQARYNLGAPLGLKQQRAEIVLLMVNSFNDSSASSLFDTWSATNNRFGLANFHQSPLQAEMLLRFRN